MKSEGLNFRAIDADNAADVLKIKVKSGQERFIETVAECLEEAALYSEWHPVAIYNFDQVIGFAMYGAFGANTDTWIDRIIIDETFQGKGYGKEAMKQLIKIVAKEYGVDTIYLSIVEENEVARHLYESMGFEEMNERDPNGELLFQYRV
ncbi:N-acetyltransferase family protein [Jeotgalibaca porci]|uniref:GNAT family N-acetyltransferase n=1 Tax=Jeotgalibaca porci TaxID=1868793 RepID=UPI0035A04460